MHLRYMLSKLVGNMRTLKAEDDIRGPLLNNPCVPPKGDICFINNLPPELLSYIFEVGVEVHNNDDEDKAEDLPDTLSDDDLDEDDINDKDCDPNTSDDEDELPGGDEDETDEEKVFDANGSSDLASFQILVSRVCSHWRNVAISTPSLWTTIIVTPECRPPYQHVSTMLERSGGLPIDIIVGCEHDCVCGCSEPVLDSDLEFLYSLLIPHIHRWRAVRIEVAKYSHVFVFLSAVSDPAIPAAPQLTSLELCHCEESVDMDELSSFRFSNMADHFVLFGGLAPRLTSVILWGVHVDWDQPWIASSSTLKELELTFHPDEVRPSWPQFASILRGASSLERLSLELSGPSGDPEEWFAVSTSGRSSDLNPPIQLPNVTSLTLTFHSERRAIGLLHSLCFPVLKELVLNLGNGDYTDFMIELAGPATSLSSGQEKLPSLLNNIEKLKIGRLPCRPECAERLYEELHNLHSLNISMSFLPKAFLNILSETPASAGRTDILLPRLITLHVSRTSVDDVREVVEERREADVPLTSLHLEQSCDMTEWDVRWFKRNVKTFETFKGSDEGWC